MFHGIMNNCFSCDAVTRLDVLLVLVPSPRHSTVRRSTSGLRDYTEMKLWLSCAVLMLSSVLNRAQGQSDGYVGEIML